MGSHVKVLPCGLGGKLPVFHESCYFFFRPFSSSSKRFPLGVVHLRWGIWITGLMTGCRGEYLSPTSCKWLLLFQLHMTVRPYSIRKLLIQHENPLSRFTALWYCNGSGFLILWCSLLCMWQFHFNPCTHVSITWIQLFGETLNFLSVRDGNKIELKIWAFSQYFDIL